MTPKTRRMRDVVIECVTANMERHDRLFFLTADFGSPALDVLAARYPDRYINVGIAEQTLINVSAGLALEGFSIVAYAIAPFITMRCYEQIRVNLSILGQVRPLHVTLVGVGAGFSYDFSGPTHQTLEDLAIMRVLPGIQVLSPSDPALAVGLMKKAITGSGVRYLRLDGKPLPDLESTDVAPEVLAAGFRVLSDGAKVTVVATGYMVHAALRVAAKVVEVGGGQIRIVDVFDLTSVDRQALADALQDCERVVTMEEGFVGVGGLDALVSNVIREAGLNVQLETCGLRQAYPFEAGGRGALLKASGFDEQAIAERIGMLWR